MTLLKSLGISSQQEAAELEQDLGVRFDDFTPQDADTWNRQTLYLYQFANTRTFTHAIRAAGVSLRHARTWHTENTLGFNQRLEIAVLEYTEDIEVILLEQVRQPKPSPALLAMLLRAQMPEKYGPSRRQSAPRDSHSDHDDPKPETSQDDRDSLEDIRQDLQQLKQFAGLTEPTPNLSPTEGQTHRDGAHTPQNLSSRTHSVIPAQAGIHPPPSTPSAVNPTPQNLEPSTQNPSAVNPLPSVPSVVNPTPQNPEPAFPHPEPSTQNPAPALSRRQRRQLQRKQRKHTSHPNTGAKQPNSHRPRAPT